MYQEAHVSSTPRTESSQASRLPACKGCSSPLIEEDLNFPLCWDCRCRLSLRGFPRAAKILCALVVATLIYSAVLFPETIKATHAYAEGRKAEKARNFAVALADYQTVLATYPDSALAVAHLGLTYYRSGDVNDAIWVLGDLWGQDNPKEVAIPIRKVFREIKQRAGVK